MPYGILSQAYGSGLFETIGTLVNDVACEIGLIPYTQKANVFGNNNPVFGQLIQLSKNVGRMLWRKRQWTHLLNNYTFNTVANQASYAFPSDYGRMVDQTIWNRTNRLPVGGPLSPQQYEFIKARLAGTVFNVLFRELSGQFTAYPDAATPGNYAISYEYISNAWLIPPTIYFNYLNGSTNGAVAGSPWRPFTAYAANAYVVSNDVIWQCVTGGVSGNVTISLPNNGTFGTNITDGNITWTYYGLDSGTAKSPPRPWLPNAISPPFYYVTNSGNIYENGGGGKSGTVGPSGTGNGSPIYDGSLYWVYLGPAGATQPGSDGDIVLFDSHLFTRALKLEFLKAKGLDSSAAQDDFEKAFEAISNDEPAPILQLVGGSSDITLLGAGNIPITGYGA